MNPGGIFRIGVAIALAFAAAAASAGPPMSMPAPPNIILLPHNPVLDENCVRKIKQNQPAVTQAELAHQCRKAYAPGPNGDPRLLAHGQPAAPRSH